LKLFNYLKKAAGMPPGMLLKKIYRKITGKLGYWLSKFIDFHADTRIKQKQKLKTIDNSLISVNDIDVSKIDFEIASYLSNMYLAHRFDLLGSGWLKNSYDADTAGIEDYKYNSNINSCILGPDGDLLNNILIKPHRVSAQKIWKLLKSHKKEYHQIDWQRDFKSGFRWSARKHYHEQRIGRDSGADIKMPWELSRMQHFPQMAVFAIKLSGSVQYKNKLLLEFMSQFIDFTAANPPRMGANWACTMDVGIRAANLLVAYDLFSQLDNENLIGADFKQLFSNSIYEHGLHIINNLEYSEFLTSNHYLSDIAGLLFISAYLEITDETILWLAFAIQEVINEIRKQFYEDGANFEASTSYHRLSGEIALYCAALISGIKGEKVEALKNYDGKKLKIYPKLKPVYEKEYKIENGSVILPDWFFERLYKAGMFTVDITKPTGEIPQIGDNDSGRGFRFSPAGTIMKTADAVKKYKNLAGYARLAAPDEDYWDENILDHSTYISAMAGFFADEEFEKYAVINPLEKSLVKSFLGNGNVGKLPGLKVAMDSSEKWRGSEESFDGSLAVAAEATVRLKIHKSTILLECDGSLEKSLISGLKYKAYKDFGLYLYKSSRLYLAVFAGPNGQNGNGGHAHNDKLSFELNIDGKDIFVDAGTYLYTPLPQRRNQFRSVKAHNVPIHRNREQNEWLEGPAGLFSMPDSTKCELLNFSINNLTIKLTYGKIIHIRSFIIESDQIRIEDHSNSEFSVNLNDFKLYSNGYGKLIYD